LIANIDVHQAGAGADVEVGYKGEETGSSIANSREQRGAWVESGTKPHLIQTKRKGGKKAITVDGGAYANAFHPGYRGKGVAKKAIAASSWEVLADVVDQIDRIIGGRA
jgi:hypothetical protein